MNSLVQRVRLEADPCLVFEELTKWHTAPWWPRIPVTFTKLSDDKDDALYLQQVKLPFGPKWRTKVASIDDQTKKIRRCFLDGMFKDGFEEVAVNNADSGGIEVAYTFYYRINNPFLRGVWDILFKRMHCHNITKVLRSLKRYVEKQR